MNAIRTGYEITQARYTLLTSADLCDSTETIPLMLEAAKQHHAAIVCGCRYMKGGGHLGGPVFKGLLSRLACLILYYTGASPTKDITNNFKLYQKSMLNGIEIESRHGFEFGMEMVIKAFKRGQNIVDVPTIWRERQHGKSRFRLWAWMPAYLRWFFKAFKHGKLS